MRRLRNTFTLVWKLLLICLIAGLVLGLVNNITEKRIETLADESAAASRKEAFPDAKAFRPVYAAGAEEGGEEKQPLYYEAYDNENCEGAPIGYVASALAYGYGGNIEVMIGMDPEKKVVGCVIGRNSDFSETAGLGAKVQNPEFAAQFIGLTYNGAEQKYSEGGGSFLRIPAGSLRVETVEAGSEGSDPDAISGASYSSRAVMKAFNEAAQLICTAINNQGGEN